MANKLMDTGAYPKRKKDEEELNNALANAVRETQKELNARGRTKGTNSGLTGDFEQDFVRMQSMRPAEIQKGMKELEERKKQQWISPQYHPTDEDRMLKYQKDEDDFIDKTFWKYAIVDNKDGRDIVTNFNKRSMQSIYGYDSKEDEKSYYKDKADVEKNKKFWLDDFPNMIPGINLYDLVWAALPYLGQIKTGTFLIPAIDNYMSGYGQAGIGNIDIFAGDAGQKQKMYLQKQDIANELLKDSYYKYLVKDTLIDKNRYIDDLQKERNRLRRLPYSSENQQKINKIDMVIYMNKNYDKYEKQFKDTVDWIYEQQKK